MSKVFELVSASELSAVAGVISTNGKQGKELVSKYVLSSLKHFAFNGKKVSVLQEQINELLAVRPRDFDVIEMSIRLLSPVKVKADKKAKSIEILGLPSSIQKAEKPDTKPEVTKKKVDAENFFFKNTFTDFAEGKAIAVDNAEYFDGCNEGKAQGAADVIPATVKEEFNQCIFDYCARVKDISLAKASAKAEREKAAKEAAGEVVHTRIDSELLAKKGGYKSILNDKITGILANITEEHLANAEAPEVKELTGAVAAYREQLEDLLAKLDTAEEMLVSRDEAIKGAAKAAAVAEFSDEELAAILASRQSSTPATAE